MPCFLVKYQDGITRIKETSWRSHIVMPLQSCTGCRIFLTLTGVLHGCGLFVPGAVKDRAKQKAGCNDGP